ncbi:P-loop NTPase fold protein [Mesorhizobium sp. CO1-1-8]|uniref:P-loop NTPase fold protein n=1 Tax=Mesorhizobium sp. CO1-1-8 TaxID=2876631 RepID=UPI001CD0819A|nr:P-loop NTPase fold protein [Mesorhizobium sp. CO1-1-8]MBZ9772427.1 hypothetical protein [Mesorhizobium sp. CO1-1-8]
MLGLDRGRSPTLKTTIERGIRYVNVDNEAQRLVFDTRALFIGLVAAGQEDRDSIRYGNTASWFVDWLRRRIKPELVSEMVVAQLSDSDLIFSALGKGYKIQLSVSVDGLLKPASGIAQRTIETPEYEARHLFGAMMVRGVIADQIRQLFSLDLTVNDIRDLAETLIDRIMTSPQPNETKKKWEVALGSLFGPEPATAGPASELNRLLDEHGLSSATDLATQTLALAAELNQPGGDIQEISSSRLFAAALQLARTQPGSAELSAVTALAQLAGTAPFRGINDVVDAFSAAPSLGGRRIKPTDNVTEIQLRAVSMAAAFGQAGVLRLDTLVASLLTQPGTKLQARLEEASIDLSHLRMAVLERLEVLDGSRIRLWYMAFGATLPARLVTGTIPPESERVEATRIIFANLRNDSSEGDTLDDKLNVEDEARAFARVAAARQVLPPLAFGIFGDWGSGKSFFMRLIYRHVASLANEAIARKGDDPAFHRQIVQIRFNAWHYAETNLWASLVDNIFVELDRWLRANVPGTESSKPTLLDQLATARELTLDSAERLISQRRQQKLASERVASAERELVVQRGRMAAAPHLFWKVVGQSFVSVIASNKDLKKAAEKLGFDQLKDDGEALKSALDSLGDETKRAQIIAKATRAQLLNWPFLALALAVLLVIPPIVDWFGAWLSSQVGKGGILDQLFDHVHLAVVQASAVFITVAGAIGQVARGIKQAATVVDKHRETLSTAIEKRLKEPGDEVKRAEEQLAKLTAELAESKAVLTATSTQLAQITKEYEGETGNGRLLRFVRDRAGDGAYAKHLGLIATIRKDFTELSGLMVAADEATQQELVRKVAAYNARVETLITTAAKAELFTSDEQRKLRESGKMATTPGPGRFERIILYIDDLDRCPPEKVVQVLQAVHLLLSFPLFVVVVAVDSRWVSKSLASHYDKLLAENGSDGATAGDYLEKIFQVPYWVRGMSSEGSRALLSALSAQGAQEKAPTSVTSAGEDVAEEIRLGERLPPETAQSATPSSPERPVSAGQERPVETPSSGAIDATALTLTDTELGFLGAIAPFTGQTPRRALRFLNTYRVIKASLNSSEITRLEAGGYRALMTQLAIVTGSPGLRQTWAETLDGSKTKVDTHLMTKKLAEAGNAAQSSRLLLGALGAFAPAGIKSRGLVEDLKHYGDIARRYSFESG